MWWKGRFALWMYCWQICSCQYGPKSAFQHLVESMIQRTNAVLKANAGSTQYWQGVLNKVTSLQPSFPLTFTHNLWTCFPVSFISGLCYEWALVVNDICCEAQMKGPLPNLFVYCWVVPSGLLVVLVCERVYTEQHTDIFADMLGREKHLRWL